MNDEEEINAQRGIHYTSAVDTSDVHYPRAELREEIEAFWEWMNLGIANKWCSDIVCGNHDGLPMSDEEMEDEDPHDLCVAAVRIYGSRPPDER